MMDLINGCLLIALLIIFVVNKLIKDPKKSATTHHREEDKPNQTEVVEEYFDPEIENTLNEINQEIETIQYIKNAYTPKWMFTLNEKRAYYKLKEIAQKHDLVVFAKVRLFDLITPVRNHPKYKTNLYKIQAKHVDFVLTKSNLVARYVIELDDSSHEAPDRKARDKFVDTVLTTCGYRVLHTKEISEEEIVKFIGT